MSMKLLDVRLLRSIGFMWFSLISNFLFSQDLSIVVNYPDSICNPGSMPLQVEVLNQGGTTVAGGTAAISWTEVGSGTWQSEVVGTPINPGSIPWIFNTWADLSSCGPNTFQVAISSPSDPNNSNDTVQFTIFSTCVINPSSVLGDTICASMNQQVEVNFDFSHFNPAILTWFATSDGGLTWTDLNTQSTLVTYTPAPAGSILLAIFDGGGICPNDTVKMVLIQQPHFVFTPNQNNLTACNNGDDVEVIITHGNNQNDNIIYSTNGQGSFDDPFDDSTSYNFAPVDYANNNLWIYAETILPAQCPFKDSIPMNWLPAPMGSTASNGPFCQGDTAIFQASGGFQYFWYNDPNDLSNSIGNQSSYSYVISQSDTLITYVIGPNGCTDTVVNFNIVSPSIEIETIPDTTVCPGDIIQLSTILANGAGSASIAWDWDPVNGLNDPFVQSPFLTVFQPSTYIVRGVSVDGCDDYDTVNISFPPGLNFEFFPDTLICPGTAVILESNAQGGTIQWTPNQWMSNPTDPNPAVTPAQTVIYFAEFDAGICIVQDTITVFVDDLQTPLVTADSFFCFNQNYTADVSVGNAVSIDWYINGSPSSNGSTVNYQCQNEDSLDIVCQITTLNGCVFDLSRVIFPGNDFECGEEINNAFSPNGDGINDTWVINILDGTTPNTVDIFTRYGDRLVSFINYDNVNIVWDGANSAGKKMPSGTYYYVVEIGGNRVAGWVNISE